MYELCQLLASKKTAKPRAPRKPSIGVGKAVIVWGRDGIVVSRLDARRWNVEVEGRAIAWFDRDAITVKGV